MKLTEKDILNLKPRGERYSVTIDGTPGLNVKIYPTGRRKYFVQGKPPGPGNQVTVTLGDVGGVTLEWARTRSQECMQLMKQGKNPNRVQQDSADNTVERLVGCAAWPSTGCALSIRKLSKEYCIKIGWG